MGRLLFRPRAWQDITETAEYLEAESGIELAERFIDAVKKTAGSLLKMPMIGSPCRFERLELRDCRALLVNDFERGSSFTCRLRVASRSSGFCTEPGIGERYWISRKLTSRSAACGRSNRARTPGRRTSPLTAARGRGVGREPNLRQTIPEFRGRWQPRRACGQRRAGP